MVVRAEAAVGSSQQTADEIESGEMLTRLTD